jgi:thiol-disulfide isomerase/thioredoxin
VGATDLPELDGRTHLLFFWATWCAPCKQAVPEVMALAEARGLPVLAISDEDRDTVASFLKGTAERAFPPVAVDPLRKSFISYGVSGTPTILLVDGEGVIRHRQVGYSSDKGLTLAGWSWRPR